MYLDYWQLDAKPFEPSLIARDLFKTAALEAASRKIRYAIDNCRAAAVVAGPAGVGKTLLVHALRESLDDRSRPFVHVVFPQMSDRDLLVYLAEQFGAPPADPPRHTTEESLRRLEFILGAKVRDGRRPILVVDEAHLLEDAGLLEPLRLLLNFHADGATALTLLLVGQLPLVPIIERHGALDERIDLKILLPCFTIDETADYVQLRMERAGAVREIFAADALATVHQLCGGVPRRINRLCDLALLVGFAEGQHTVTSESLHAVHGELTAVLTPAA